MLSLTFRESIRAKWLLLFAVVFFLLAIDIPDLIAAQTGILPPGYLGTFLDVIIPLAFPLIPLLSLPMAATTIVDERESGTLQYVLSNPISKSEFFLGKSMGLLLATTIAVFAGFGAAGVVSYGAQINAYGGLDWIIWYGIVLNMAMLAMGMIVSTLSKRKVTALVTAIFLWLFFNTISSVSQLAIVVNAKFGEFAALCILFLNPIQTAQVVTSMTLNQPDTYWGTLGLISYIYYGSNVNNVVTVLDLELLAWIVGLFAIGFFLFNRQDVG